MRLRLAQFHELGGVLPEPPADPLAEILRRLDRLEERLSAAPAVSSTTTIVRDDAAIMERLARLEAMASTPAPEYKFKVERDASGKIVSVKASPPPKEKTIYHQVN